MSYALAGIRAKLTRAADHLETLDDEARGYLKEGESHTLSQEYDPNDNCYVLRLHILRQPPIRFGVVAGEAVQQLRSSLDHLGVQLARLKHPTARSANFPIYTDRAVYVTPVGPKRRSPQRVCRYLFRPAELAIIERMQPYNHAVPRNAGLAVLQRFSNVDKHEVIHTPIGQAERVQVKVSDPGAGLEPLSGDMTGRSIGDGAEVARYRVWTGGEDNVQVEATVSMGIGYGEDFIRFPILKELAIGVIRIVDEFEAAVPELQP